MKPDRVPAGSSGSTNEPAAPAGSPVVVGADIGGTSSRIAVAATTGEVLALVTGPGANPSGGDPADAAARIAALSAEALAVAARHRRGPVTATAAVIGLAGVTTVRDTPAAVAFTEVVPGVVADLVSDLVVAYASATPEPHGVVAICGTGAGATEIDHGVEVSRRDAWGWLLGDEGSGFWIGREAIRATLRRLDRGLPIDGLAAAVMAESAATTAAGVVGAAYRRPPRDLSRLAPLVSRHAADDPEAAVILEQAATLTAERVLDVLGGRRDLPVVLTGSLVTGSGPLAAPVRGTLADAGVDRITEAGDGLAGALWLAISRSTSRSPGMSDSPPTPDAHWSDLLGSLDRYR